MLPLNAGMFTDIHDGDPQRRLDYWEDRLRFYKVFMDRGEKISESDIEWCETMIEVARLQLIGVEILLYEIVEEKVTKL